MDIFQIIGDILHVIAIIALIHKITRTKNVLGLSYRTQQLYAVVFITRYVDVFLGIRTYYLFIMKIIFVLLTLYTAYLIRLKKPYLLTYDAENDKFPHYLFYIASVILTMIVHRSLSPIHLLWSFSMWLEAFAILPQLFIISKNKDVENLTANYVLFLGLYRIFYIFHWIYNWRYIIWTAFIAGVIQSILYADFIYYYYKACKNQQKMKFPG